MPESIAINIIRSIQKKWTINSLLSYFILSVAITLLSVALLIKFTGLSLWWCMPVMMLSFITIFFIYNSWKVSKTDVTGFLNQQFPQLEESSGLLLKSYESLNLLERMQVRKVEQCITRLQSQVSFRKKLQQPGLISAIIIIISVGLLAFPFPVYVSHKLVSAGNKATIAKTDKMPAGILSVEVTIRPPLYTGGTSRSQSRFNIKAVEGSDVNWRLQTTVPADTIQFIINGAGVVPLHPINSGHTFWSIERKFVSAGFYQVKINDKLSELYSIDLIKDAPPIIVIQKPAPYTIIDYGQPQQLAMTVSIGDDYGIREATISALTTSGSGEGVKFKEQQLLFTNFKSGSRKYNLQKTLDLPALGVKPGDELYFYVRSVDNHKQESRSDIYTVSIPDTAQLMSLEGLAGGVNVKPEYFRSERQIIIETEQLLKEQKTLTAEAFKNKSNDLGIDQNLLRLRYSKFLGGETKEEGEDEHAGEHGHDAGDNAADFGNAEKIMEEVSHKHDNAEDASFFDVQTKKQLMATLSEMSNAEVRLRTFRPLEALPFEYKALRLLKDLQEKGRSYVAKAGYKTSPLKPEKRLTGDLSKIEDPVTKIDFKIPQNPDDAIRSAVGIIENLKAGTGIDKAAIETLRQAGVQLNKKVAAEPAAYLSSLGAMNRILQASVNVITYSATDLSAAQQGLQRLVSPPTALPAPGKKNPDQNLSQRYFKILHQGNR